MNKAFEKIIEKLEKQSKGYLTAYVKGILDAKKIVKEVAEEYKDGWIPCSERLPEVGKRYLVSAVWKDKDFEKSSVYDAVYGNDGLWHSYNYEPVSYEVIAWQPLPEPYKESE